MQSSVISVQPKPFLESKDAAPVSKIPQNRFFAENIWRAGDKLCKKYTKVLLQNASLAASSKNPEIIHRMRIAVRKLRIIIKLWPSAAGAKKNDALLEDLKRLAKLLGGVRDTDVLRLRFEEQWMRSSPSDEFKALLLGELEKKKSAAKTKLMSALTSEKYREMIISLKDLFSNESSGRKTLELNSFVPAILKKGMNRAARFLDGKIKTNRLHSFRIACKRLRYITEFFGDLYPEKLRERLLEFKTFQNILGTLCDARAAEEFLRDMEAKGKKLPQRNIRFEMDAALKGQRRIIRRMRKEFEKKSEKLSSTLKFLKRETKRLSPNDREETGERRLMNKN